RTFLPAALPGTFSFFAHSGQVISMGHFVDGSPWPGPARPDLPQPTRASARPRRSFPGSTGFTGPGTSVYPGQRGNASATIGCAIAVRVSAGHESEGPVKDVPRRRRGLAKGKEEGKSKRGRECSRPLFRFTAAVYQLLSRS